jgi:hypothetical protein
MKVVRWIIGIILSLTAFLIDTCLILLFWLERAIDPYWSFCLSHPWFCPLYILEFILLLPVIVMGISLPLRHFGVDRRKDIIFICLIVGFVIVAVITLYLFYLYFLLPNSMPSHTAPH